MSIWLIRFGFLFGILGGIALIAVGVEKLRERKRQQQQMFYSMNQAGKPFGNQSAVPAVMIVIGAVILLVLIGIFVYACMALKAMT